MSYLEQTGSLTVERLELLAEIVGRSWLDNQLRRYQAFRECHSPSSRWWHRLPNVSPIVPLVFWAKPGPTTTLENPFGVWRGDPTGILARFLASFVEFKNYWEQLPKEVLQRHLRYAFRHPWRFFGIRHELRLSTHMKGSGYYIEPLFLNPISEKGGADILVKDGKTIYDVQCKARNPSVATSLPYDVFQYIAGSWVRLVEESRRSYFLYIIVKQKIDLDGANRLLDKVRSLLRTDLTTSGRLESEDCDIQIIEIGYGEGRLPPQKLREKALQETQNALYTEFELIKPASQSRRLPHVAGFHVVGNKRHLIEHYVYSTTELAAKSHIGSNPLIISVNLYHEVDMNVYMNGPSVVSGFKAWTEQFFKKYPNVAMVMLSANYDRYLPIDGVNFAVSAKYLLLESPTWDNVLLKFGVS